MNRKHDRYTSRQRGLNSSYGSSPSVLGSMVSSQYRPYSNNYSNSYTASAYRNYNPYTVGLGRPSSLGIYGGTSSGYGGVYLSSATLGSLNLMTPVLKKLDKKILASQKNFKVKSIPPPKAQEQLDTSDVAPVRPERKSRSATRDRGLSKERSRSLTSLDSAATLDSRSLSLNSVASEGYCSNTEERSEENLDYKKLYEDAMVEVKRLQVQLSISETKLVDSEALVKEYEKRNANMSEIEKREKRAMIRKLSEMEEELKNLTLLQVETQRLRDENSALIRVISKLSK
ncbi:Protein phosphatase 1 regulatory subunit 12B [Papilio xuthus]|uniref:Protein phosphatase 1 regulatory subunit 12B n=1 Tax=Papilio xuthus TaxID=66420 RepID=A0A194Q5E4_PAPXU|nr:Protein phosphatase 1 regulatory subunit 12B [Papilio xuthus]